MLGAVEYERIPARLRGRLRRHHRRRVGGDPLGTVLGGLAVEAFGVQATLIGIGAAVAVTSYGFFNAAFREMDTEGEPVPQSRS